ncbi:MAG: ATP-binding cassette domain-containing protein [Aestuariivirga sp.]|uniref:ATP-binding cassette domain-containing protein n=1 Tax=Aestuariivirga sp. TaxID=2650926 RepID=UPI0025BABC32|nr:ATP-binding cassette domain-containing protein [Aestuariivirga sp.]MCA3561691.1 ATP-binding cassette domain-containing protein [Aestuariivirga sp.]
MNSIFNSLMPMLKFLWSHAPQRLKYLVLGLALVAGLSRDWVMMVVNKAAASPVHETMSVWLPMFIATFVTVIAATFLYQILATVVTTKVINNVRLRLIRGLLKAQPSLIDRREHGALYHILTTDVSAVAGFTNTVLNMMPAVIFLTIAVPQVFYYSLVAGFFVILVMIGGTLSYHLQQKKMARLNDDGRALEVAYFERVSEMLRGFRELRLHRRRRDSFSGDIDRVLERLRKVLIRVNIIYETGESSVHALKFLLFAGIVFLVPYLVRTESVVTFQVLTLVLFSLTPFEQIVSSYPAVIGTLVSYMRIDDLARELAEIERAAGESPGYTLPARAPKFEKIALRGIETRYAARETSSFALGPLDFELRRGEVVFLVGSNGSGKTTFMNVLTGLLEPTAGSIEVDGAPVNFASMDAYRAQFSAVFTQFHVFRQLYGLEDVTQDTADEMVRKVHLDGITRIQPDGITRIDLSAGQRRRLALAVALLEDRNVLVLDEFVADQDPERRKYFFNVLVPWLKQQGKTVIVSTHDLAWLNCCDRVLSFENGKMTEEALPPARAASAAAS